MIVSLFPRHSAHLLQCAINNGVSDEEHASLFGPFWDSKLGKCSGASCPCRRCFACFAEYTRTVHYLSAIKIVPCCCIKRLFFSGLQLPR